MGRRIAKVHQHAIAQILRNMPLVARDDLATGSLIGHYAGMIVFGVELLGEGGGPHQVNEHHRQLAALAGTQSRVFQSRVERLGIWYGRAKTFRL